MDQLGKLLVELIERHDPVAVVIDGASPAATLLGDLEERGLRRRTQENQRGQLVVLNASGQGRSCGALQDAIAGDAPDAWHRGDPIVREALKGSTTRNVGDGQQAFDRRNSDADITPLVAIAQAHHGLVTTPRSHGPLVAWRGGRR